MRPTDVVVHDVRIGGTLVRLRFAGSALIPVVLPALGHLRTEATGEKPALTVQLWDATSTGVFPPRLPCRGVGVPARGEIRQYGHEGVRAAFHDGVYPRDGSFRSVTVLDDRISVAWLFVLGRGDVQWNERAAPLRVLLHWALSRPDRLLVHAGAVAIDGRALLVAGPGGSGKSTTAIAAFLAGCDYLGDDYVLVDLAGPQPMAHSLYGTAKLAPEALALLPGLPGSPGTHVLVDDEKHVIAVPQLRAGGLVTRARIVGIVVPRPRPGGRTTLRHASPGFALQALAPSTIFQAPKRDGAALGPLAGLARRVPSYGLDLGGTPGDAAALLSALLREELPSVMLPPPSAGHSEGRGSS